MGGLSSSWWGELLLHGDKFDIIQKPSYALLIISVHVVTVFTVWRLIPFPLNEGLHVEIAPAKSGWRWGVDCPFSDVGGANLMQCQWVPGHFALLAFPY